MKKNALILFLVACQIACMNKQNVDLIVHNGTIYTVDENFTVNQAMAVNGDSIVETGAEHYILNKYSASHMLDLRSQYVYPGFIDAHCHFLGLARQIDEIDLRNVGSDSAMFEQVAAWMKEHENPWIKGRGWDQNIWDNRRYPDKKWLDEHCGKHLVFLKRVDGHAVLVNQNVLDLAGIDENTRVAGGDIGLSGGKCSGILIDKAVDLVEKFIPDPQIRRYQELIQEAEEQCLSYGITTVSDAGLDYDEVEMLENMQRDGKLKIKLYVMLNPTSKNRVEFFKRGIVSERDISIRSFKFYADGALGSRGACLLEPYSDVSERDHYGLILTDRDSLLAWANELYRKGFQMNTHAIGDSANRMMLHLYAGVLKGSNDRRWRVEHAQVIDPADISLFGRYNIIPSVQPGHAISDMKWAGLRLGGERVDHAYLLKSLEAQNGLLALGTDFPVEVTDPLRTAITAIYRTETDGEPEGGYHKDEAISFESCLCGMTIWAAIANFEESTKGSLVPGKKADFVICNRDLKELDPHSFAAYRITGTFINGKRLYPKAGK